VKLPIGFILGVGIGGYLVYQMTPLQRERVAARARGIADTIRSSAIARSLSHNVGDVVGAASDRVAGAVDSAGSAISDTVAPDDDPVTPPDRPVAV